MFQKGDKIICVDNTIDVKHLGVVIRKFANWIVKDKQYTVREILYNNDIVTGILLEEVHNKPIFIDLLERVQEPAFATWRFRKLNHTEIDSSSEENIMLKRQIEVETFEEIRI